MTYSISQCNETSEISSVNYSGYRSRGDRIYGCILCFTVGETLNVYEIHILSALIDFVIIWPTIESKYE